MKRMVTAMEQTAIPTTKCVPANRIARKNRWRTATHVIYGDDTRIHGDMCLSYGYRKFTTGEYVPNKYRANFGWKNTYYQCAICAVEININDFI